MDEICVYCGEDCGHEPDCPVTVIDAMQADIDRLQQWVNDLQSGMYINCVYCGHRYGPESEVPSTMADVLKEHIAQCPQHPLSEARAETASLREEVNRLSNLLNAPEIHDFAAAVVREAAHQRSRWGTEHDSGKGALEWFWLIGFLATKATQAARYGDQEKYLHHIITTAAACANWHANASGANSDMRPGAPASLESLPTGEAEASSQ